jgi:hypothetical protein
MTASAMPREAATVSELVAQAKQNPLRWLVPDLLLEDGVHILHGAEESFKTMLTLQLLEALTIGGRFLLRDVAGRLRTGIAELEMKNTQFAHRVAEFFPNGNPDISNLPDSLRRKALSGRNAKDRIGIIAGWAESEGLEFVAIDSVVKLFPPGCDPSKPDIASDVFNELQRLPTVWAIAHDRKPMAGFAARLGNAEIVGSGRFAQDPDVIHQIVRPDQRAPRADFHWGKMRAGEKFDPVPLYFDKVNYRLYPLHPYIHLLTNQPVLGSDLVIQAKLRYGWEERWAREHLATLSNLRDGAGNICVIETMKGHQKLYAMSGTPVASYSP